MSIYDMRQAIEGAEAQINDIGAYLDDLEEAVDNWEKLQNEGWDDADEVITAMTTAGEWVEVSENLGVDAEEMEWIVKNWRNACGHFDAAGFYIEDDTNMRDALEKLRAKSDGVEIITALKLLVSALVDSGVLAGTVSGLGIVKVGHPEPAFGGSETHEAATKEEA